MTITIDSSGRLVIPKALRDALGFAPGVPLEVTADGVGLRIEPVVTGGRIVSRNGRLVVESSSGRAISDDEIQAAIDASRR